MKKLKVILYPDAIVSKPVDGKVDVLVVVRVRALKKIISHSSDTVLYL